MISFLIERRALVALIVLAATLPMAWEALHLGVDPGVESLLPSRGEDLDRLRRFETQFAAGEVIVVAVYADQLFTEENLEILDDLTRRLAALPGVAHVLSPTNALDIDGDELGPFSLVPYEEIVAAGTGAEGLGKRLALHPLYGGLLVSADTRTTALLIEIERAGEPGFDRRALVMRVRELAEELGPGLEVHVAGIPVEEVDVSASIRRDQALFAPLILVMLALAMGLLYRHPTGVVVPLSVVAASLTWTLGLYKAAGRSLNPVTSLITPVVLVVSVEGVIHLLNHHLAARARGHDRHQALREAFGAVRAPCFTAALTTAIGFGALMLLPIPAIRDFGLFTAAGVLCSYGFTMVLAPLLLSWLPDLPAASAGRFAGGPIERGLRGIVSRVCRRPLVWASISCAVILASVMGLGLLRVETDLIGAMGAHGPLYRATSFIDSRLTGVNSLEILVNGIEPGDPEGIRRLAGLEREIESMTGVRSVAGLADLYARINRAFHSGDDAYEWIPVGPGAGTDLRDMLELLEREAPRELSRFVSADGRTLRLAARVAAVDTAESQRIFRRIEDAAVRAGLPRIEMTGEFVLLSNMSTALVFNQIRGLIPALALILLTMAVQFRSVRLGLLAAIPNGVPVLMVYGLMGWAGIALSVPTAMIGSVVIGMTVDNTIHLLSRFRQAWRNSGDYLQALGETVDRSGRSIVFSTIVLAAGFWVGLFSSFVPSVHFSLLTGASLLMGLASQIILLPLSLVVFRPFGAPGHVTD